ncbi:glycosyltransferase family 2 protein [Flagellimonas sp. DF-77]|uniref:glycosyltransferase family 2 protein n=1 Tax=Flagellimonas algarum TaxID=3230298 RepID=UPI003392ACDC
MKDIAVLVTCHNRKEKTLECLERLFQAREFSSNNGQDSTLTIYLTDDGSSDGTAKAVASRFPQSKIIKGSGNLFWANGMISSWEAALKNRHGFYLLLNDDTQVYEDVLEHLAKAHEYCLRTYGKPGIYIGATENKEDHQLTYSGAVVTNYILASIRVVRPDGHNFQRCDFGNANIMLVPAEVVDRIGILSKGYTHGKADYDYTMKAKKADIPSLICPVVLGHCAFDHDHSYVGWEKMTYAERKKSLFSPKGVDFRSQLKFNKKFFPLRYPLVWLSGYFKIMFPKFYLKRFEVVEHKK